MPAKNRPPKSAKVRMHLDYVKIRRILQYAERIKTWDPDLHKAVCGLKQILAQCPGEAPYVELPAPAFSAELDADEWVFVERMRSEFTSLFSKKFEDARVVSKYLHESLKKRKAQRKVKRNKEKTRIRRDMSPQWYSPSDQGAFLPPRNGF